MNSSRSASDPSNSGMRRVTRVGLAAALATAGVAHLSFARRGFQAQVPDFVPLSKDTTVVLSGFVELGLAASLLVPTRRRPLIGWLLAAFFTAIFPGNISQWRHHRGSLGMDTDAKRTGRLFGQPLLIAAALYGTGAVGGK